MHRNSAAVLLFLVPLAAGCPKRIAFGPEGEIRDPQTLLKLTQGAEAQIVTLKGESRLKVDSPQAKGTVTLFVAVSRPSLIHFESLDFFGRPQAVLVSDGQRFALLSIQENKFFTGPASPQNVSRFLPVVLPPEELVDLVLGQAPRIPATDPQLTLDTPASAYRVTLQAGPVTQTQWIHPENHRVMKSEVRGINAYDVAFDDFDDIDKVVFPRHLTLEARSSATTLELRYKDITLNESPDLTFFQLEPPPGMPVVEVDERGLPVPRPPSGDAGMP